MNKCVKMTFVVALKEGFLQNVVQKQARSLGIEGSAQVISPNHIKVIACGAKDQVDAFVDALHKDGAKYSMQDIEVEPFLKDKDYRGVFRIIE